jgi:hypothetical protein
MIKILNPPNVDIKKPGQVNDQATQLEFMHPNRTRREECKTAYSTQPLNPTQVSFEMAQGLNSLVNG